MKKQILLSAALIYTSFLSFGQITLEHTYSAPSVFAQPVLLSSNGEKYMTYDSAKVYLYNTDNTLWRTIVVSSYTGYKLEYALAVSDNLFNADNLVELVAVYAATSGTAFPQYKSEVINENGVVVQTLDTSYYATVHYNSTTNTYKLFTNFFHYSPVYYVTNVYSLPGTMPCGQCSALGVDKPGGSATQAITVSDPVPNPSSGMARINYDLPDNINQATIVFYNMAGQLVRELTLMPQSRFIDINNSLFKAGLYNYSIRSENIVSDTKTMVVR